MYFDQINAALRDFFQKHQISTQNFYIYNIYLFVLLYVVSDLVTSAGVKQVLVSL